MTEQPAAPAAQDPLHASAPRVPFTKGHGTGNDFVLIADPDGNTQLDAQRVARLADRHRGIGADGVIRAVRSARCLLYTSPSPRDGLLSRMPSSA